MSNKRYRLTNLHVLVVFSAHITIAACSYYYGLQIAPERTSSFATTKELVAYMTWKMPRWTETLCDGYLHCFSGPFVPFRLLMLHFMASTSNHSHNTLHIVDPEISIQRAAHYFCFWYSLEADSTVPETYPLSPLLLLLPYILKQEPLGFRSSYAIEP